MTRDALLVVLLCAACRWDGTAPTPTSPNAVATINALPMPAGMSEGVRTTGAEAWHAAGITGRGIKVGIIDIGFTNYAPFLGNAKVTIRSFRSDGLIADALVSAETLHGTACAEIVHEMAPDAELALAAAGDTPGGFITAIQWLVTQAHVSVITTSLGFYGEYPTDGSSEIAQAVNRARAAGVFVVKSAGNLADKQYRARFTDADGDGFHDFPGASIGDNLALQSSGGPLEIFLNWDDWTRPHINYDLLLVNSAGQEIARSDTDQARTGKQPFERIAIPLSVGTYMIKVRKVNASDPDLPLQLIVRGARMAQTTPDGSLTVPGDASGTVTVAAIDVRTTAVEPYSSRGPTLDGRKKPELSGPDHVASGAYLSVGLHDFAGTSAAAPHVGGAAALYRQAFPQATPDAIAAFLVAHASTPRGDPRGANSTGAGALNLGAPPIT